MIAAIASDSGLWVDLFVARVAFYAVLILSPVPYCARLRRTQRKDQK